MFTATGDQGAVKVYAKAGALLAGTGAPKPFDEPAFISFQVPRPSPLQGPPGFALAEFTVDAGGKPRDVRIIEHICGPLMAELGYERTTRSARVGPLKMLVHDGIQRTRESIDWQLQRLLMRM